MALNSSVIYDFAGVPKPIEIKVEGQEKPSLAVNMDDYLLFAKQTEEAHTQKLMQDNANQIAQANLIAAAALEALDPGVATLPDAIAQINSMVTIFTNFISTGKNT